MMDTVGSSETTGCLISAYRRCVVAIFVAICYSETSATNYRSHTAQFPRTTETSSMQLPD